MSLTVWIGIVAIACLPIWLSLRRFNRRNRVEVFTPQDSDRDLARKGPYFRREVVEAKVKSLFPGCDPAEIMRLLDVPSFREPERMQLNILKLSDRDPDRLRHYIEVARTGRGSIEVIDSAEYPESSRIGMQDKDFFWGEHKRLIERDTQQYLKWLKKK